MGVPAVAGRRAAAEAARGVTAGGLLMSAVVHLELWAQGVNVVPVIGPLFMLNVVGGFAIALVLLVWKHWLPVAAAIGYSVLTLAAFGMAVTVGLFGSHEVAAGVPQLLAGVAELVSVVGGAVLLLLGPGRD